MSRGSYIELIPNSYTYISLSLSLSLSPPPAATNCLQTKTRLPTAKQHIFSVPKLSLPVNTSTYIPSLLRNTFDIPLFYHLHLNHDGRY